MLSANDALKMLAEWVGEKSPDKLPPEAAEVARECGYLPLALAMIGAMIRLRPTAWKDALGRRAARISERSSVPFRATWIYIEATPRSFYGFEEHWVRAIPTRWPRPGRCHSKTSKRPVQPRRNSYGFVLSCIPMESLKRCSVKAPLQRTDRLRNRERCRRSRARGAERVLHLVRGGATQISTGLRFGLPAEFVLALVFAYSSHPHRATD